MELIHGMGFVTSLIMSSLTRSSKVVLRMPLNWDTPWRMLNGPDAWIKSDVVVTL